MPRWYLPKGAQTICTLKTQHTDSQPALFIIVKTGEQPECLSVSEQRNCGVYRQWNSVSAKRNELPSHEKT